MSPVRRAVPTLTGRQGNRARPLFAPTICYEDAYRCELRVPVPPSANRYYRNFRGRMVMAAEGRAYKELIGLLRLTKFRPKGDVTIRIEWYRGERRGDVGNIEKCLMDALQGVAYQNDSQIQTLSVARFDIPDFAFLMDSEPRCRVFLKRL